MTKYEELKQYYQELKKKYFKKGLCLCDLTSEDRDKFVKLLNEVKREQISREIERQGGIKYE